MNRWFSKDEIQMDNKHTKTCSTSLAIREGKLKLYWNSLPLPLEWRPSRKQRAVNAGEDVDKEHKWLTGGWWKSKLMWPLWKLVLGLLKTHTHTQIECLPHDPAILSWTFSPRIPNSTYYRDIWQCLQQYCSQSLSCGANLDVQQERDR